MPVNTDMPYDEDEVPELNRRWLKVGVELEGGWADHSRASLDTLVGSRGSVHGDGSVHISGFSEEDNEPGECDYCAYGRDESNNVTECTCDDMVSSPSGYVGEISSRPYQRWSSIEGFIRRCHPTTVNATCGFHIHASFSVTDMSRLMEHDFNLYFKEKWRQWGIERGLATGSDFFRRLRGDNQFCRTTFMPDEQMRSGENATRYTQLNFAAYARHGTLECRLLPMFPDVNDTVAAARHLLDMYNDFLTNAPPIPLDGLNVEVAPIPEGQQFTFAVESEVDGGEITTVSIDGEANECDIASLREADVIIHGSMSTDSLREAMAEYIWSDRGAGMATALQGAV